MHTQMHTHTHTHTHTHLQQREHARASEVRVRGAALETDIDEVRTTARHLHGSHGGRRRGWSWWLRIRSGNGGHIGYHVVCVCVCVHVSLSLSLSLSVCVCVCVCERLCTSALCTRAYL